MLGLTPSAPVASRSSSEPKCGADMDLVSKPRGKSVVWLYFGLKADERGRPLNSGEAVCRLCRKVVLAKGGNTTNLRSHLRRRHRADFLETPSSSASSSAALFEAQGLDLNHEELFEDVPFLQTAANQSYVPDAVLPPGEPWLRGGPPRAALSVPSCLCLRGDVAPPASGGGRAAAVKVRAKCHLQQGVMFGPYLGEVCRGRMPTHLKYAWAIRDDAAFVFVDASDENRSNWMRYVTYTSRVREHNLVVFQFYRRIYYRISRPVAAGEELKVWIGKDYAALLGLGMGDSVKCEVGDKETVLRLLQDIQPVTLPEPSSSSLWSDRSHSQSPAPVIGDATAVSSLDAAASDSAAIAGFALLLLPSSSSSSSPIALPSPCSYQNDKYDSVSGAERLLSNPSAPHSSPWHFFGFEADPCGRPLDRGTVVCKLCGEGVGCGGAQVELQNHLTNRHHIRPRDARDRTIGHHRPQPATANSGLVGTLPLPPPGHVINAIADFLVTDLQPPALVEGEGFRRLIRTLLPFRGELPSSRRLERLLRERHAEGRMSLAQELRRRRVAGGTGEETSDHTAPVEFETGRCGRPPSRRREVPHFVTLSVDVWFRNWQGSDEGYLTLWAHYIDSNFKFQNLALATQRLAANDREAVEAQAQAMAQQWGVSQPNVVLLGGEGRSRMAPGSPNSESGAATPRPNSTTFPERDDAVSPEGPERWRPADGPPSVPCFFSAVRDCVEEAMSHPVVAETLGKIRVVLAALFPPAAQSRPRPRHARRLLRALTPEERAELKSWARGRPAWNKLFPLLSTLVRHRGLFDDAVKEIEGEAPSKEDAPSESNSSGGGAASDASPGAATLRSEWDVLEELCLVLRPLDVACRTLNREAFPRLSLVKPILTGLLTRHLAPRPGESSSAASSSSVLRELKGAMRRRLASCYDSPAVNRVVCVACSLDPQFHGLGFMEEEERTATFHWLKKEAVRIVTEERRRGRVKAQRRCERSPSPGSPESEGEFRRRGKRLKDSRPIDFRELEDEEEESDAGDDDDDDDGEEFADPGPQAGLSGMEFLLGDLFPSAPRSRQSSVEESIDTEMSAYRADRGASLGVEPLRWWRTKAGRFPMLAAVARAYLAAPSVAGNAARDFAPAGAGAARRKRANISPDSLDSMLFLHYNHKPTSVSFPTAGRNEESRGGIEKVP